MTSELSLQKLTAAVRNAFESLYPNTPIHSRFVMGSVIISTNSEFERLPGEFHITVNCYQHNTDTVIELEDHQIGHYASVTGPVLASVFDTAEHEWSTQQRRLIVHENAQNWMTLALAMNAQCEVD